MTDNSTTSKDKRPFLRSELDMAFLTTDSVWGKNEVNEKFKDKTTKEKVYFTPKLNADGSIDMGEDGKPKFEVITEKDVLWNTLSFFTRDFRLGNLNRWSGDLEFCEYYTQLAGDFLHEGMKEPFNIALSRVAGKLELSQSVGGFFRRRSGTFTHEQIKSDLEPTKANLFGKSKG